MEINYWLLRMIREYVCMTSETWHLHASSRFSTFSLVFTKVLFAICMSLFLKDSLCVLYFQASMSPSERVTISRSLIINLRQISKLPLQSFITLLISMRLKKFLGFQKRNSTSSPEMF